MARPRNLTLCSFCGKSHAEVRKLVSGPGVYICDGCVETFKQVLDKELAEKTPKAAQGHNKLRKRRRRMISNEKMQKRAFPCVLHLV